MGWFNRKQATSTSNPDSTPRIHRRDLLAGRLWKLFSHRHKTPLMMRYPRTRTDVSEGADTPAPPQPPEPAVRSVQGISVSAVPVSSSSAPAQSNRWAPIFRPPGAVAEPQFLAGCTRCRACIDACPHGAIGLAPTRLQSQAGTPMLNPDVQPCLMCHDFPCIAACEPKVLRDGVPKLMGTARVTEHLCLAHHGTTCTVCSERCPVEGAIRVSAGKPSVVEEVCTGCGVCRYVCPAPENAILLMPTFSRPAAP